MVSGHLSIYIDEVQNLQHQGGKGKIFYVAHVGGQRYRSQDSKEKGDHASFDDEIKFEVPNGVNSVLFQIWEDKTMGKDILLGEGTYPLQTLFSQGQEQANITIRGDIQGKLTLRASFKSADVQVDDSYFASAFKDHEHRYKKPPGDHGYEDPQKKLTSKDKTAIGVGAGLGGAALLGGAGFGIYKGIEKHKEKKRSEAAQSEDYQKQE